MVAYTVAESDVKPDELSHYLKEKLPEHMVPAAFVPLDEMPLTPNGKVDRKALPEPSFSRDVLEEDYVAPRTELEEVLTNIWADILDVERVGIHDSFFRLGGHSLLATQVISRMRDMLRIEISLMDFFKASTVAGVIEHALRDTDRRERAEKTAQLLLKLAQLSDDEVKEMLKEKSVSGKGERE